MITTQPIARGTGEATQDGGQRTLAVTLIEAAHAVFLVILQINDSTVKYQRQANWPIATASLASELGIVRKSCGRASIETMTDPGQAVSLVQITGVDALAVGTGHGQVQQETTLDPARIRVIRKRVTVPLVLLSSSGLPQEDLRLAATAAISTINLAPRLRWH